jgi:hypothetical protein
VSENLHDTDMCAYIYIKLILFSQIIISVYMLVPLSCPMFMFVLHNRTFYMDLCILLQRTIYNQSNSVTNFQTKEENKSSSIVSEKRKK